MQFQRWTPCFPPVVDSNCDNNNNNNHCRPNGNSRNSAQFVSNLNFMPPCEGQNISGTWPLGNIQPIEFGTTAIADGNRITLSGNNTVVLQPGRYLIDVHALVANFDNWDPQFSDPIVTKLYLNNQPLEYTTNSVDVLAQLFTVNSTQLNKSNIVLVSQANSTLQWMAGNTVSADFNFEIYEASITIVEL